MQTPYPAFTPDQFLRVQTAAEKAALLAEKAVGASPHNADLRRDVAMAKAARLRWPDGSQSGPGRNHAETQYAAALEEFGGHKAPSRSSQETPRLKTPYHGKDCNALFLIVPDTAQIAQLQL